MKENGRTISLVVTHYDETWNVCRPLFDSIAVQTDFDLDTLEVIVINDGMGNKLPYAELSKYPFCIKQFHIEHKGVSAARNEGIKKATGDYIMFCDCDDMFCSMFSLQIYDKAIREGQGNYDIIRGSFIEDQFIDGEWKLIRHDNDITFIHGKLYRTEFIKENNLAFDESLTIHEEAVFVALSNMLTPKIRETQVATYLWKYRNDSIVRKDPDMFIFKTYSNLMAVRRALCEELAKREMITEYRQTVVKTVIDCYYDFQKHDALKPENAELILKAKKSFKKFYNRFKNDYHDVNVNDIAAMMNVCRPTAVANGLKVEQQSLKDFLTEIVNL